MKTICVTVNEYNWTDDPTAAHTCHNQNSIATKRWFGDLLQLTESQCLIYDIRGAGASWLDPTSYHNVHNSVSVYVSSY